jgi:hypothetical protein
LSSKLQKFTFNEAFNAITPQNLGYDVQPLWSWALEDSIPETSTRFCDVSDAYKLTLQCGDWMHIKFFSGTGVVDIAPNGDFDVDVASSTTGTHWTTGSDWSISNGRAICTCTDFSALTSTNSSLLSAGQHYQIKFDIGTHKLIGDANPVGGHNETISYYVTGNISNGSQSGLSHSGVSQGSKSVEFWAIPTHNTNIGFFAGSAHHIFIDNIVINEMPNIERDDDFAIPPGIHEIVVPRGYMDEQIIFAALPYNNYTEALGPQFLRIVKHG